MCIGIKERKLWRRGKRRYLSTPRACRIFHIIEHNKGMGVDIRRLPLSYPNVRLHASSRHLHGRGALAQSAPPTRHQLALRPVPVVGRHLCFGFVVLTSNSYRTCVVYPDLCWTERKLLAWQIRRSRFLVKQVQPRIPFVARREQNCSEPESMTISL